MGNAARMRDWLVGNKITLSFAPTFFAEELIALRWPGTASLRYLFTGGDRLRTSPPPALPFRLVNNYGPTENAVVTTSGFVPPARASKSPGIGRPIDNVWVRIVDRALQPVPPGGTGELIVGGSSLARGYWNRPELTHEKFVTLSNGERAYRTGDLCRLRRDGEIEFCGRADMQVKVRGCRIELGEIESALMAHPFVREAAARITQLSNGQNGIVAYVVVGNEPATAESLRACLSTRLPSYMVPSSFVWLETLPKTVHGKIDQKRLPPPVAVARTEELKILPRTATEIELAALWKNLLRVESVAIHDDFFELGGDSLSATRFATSVRKQFGVELPLSRMMRAPTIEALSAFIETEHRSKSKLPDGLIVLRLPSQRDALPPLFFTPPASGSPACYRFWLAPLPAIARYMDLRRPVSPAASLRPASLHRRVNMLRLCSPCIRRAPVTSPAGRLAARRRSKWRANYAMRAARLSTSG
jgi:acyl carrier protein